MVSRLLEIILALRARGQEVISLRHDGTYEYVAREAGFAVVAVEPQMSPQHAAARKIVTFLGDGRRTMEGQS